MNQAASWRGGDYQGTPRATTLDVVITVIAKPGKPVPVGHWGTVVLGDSNANGETILTFTLDSHRAKKLLRQSVRFDKLAKRRHTK